MNANEFNTKFLQCISWYGTEEVRVVSDTHCQSIHNVADVRVNRNNGTIEIVVTE